MYTRLDLLQGTERLPHREVVDSASGESVNNRKIDGRPDRQVLKVVKDGKALQERRNG